MTKAKCIRFYVHQRCLNACMSTHFNTLRGLTQYLYDPGISLGSAYQCILGNVYLRSDVPSKCLRGALHCKLQATMTRCSICYRGNRLCAGALLGPMLLSMLSVFYNLHAKLFRDEAPSSEKHYQSSHRTTI